MEWEMHTGAAKEQNQTFFLLLKHEFIMYYIQ